MYIQSVSLSATTTSLESDNQIKILEIQLKNAQSQLMDAQKSQDGYEQKRQRIEEIQAQIQQIQMQIQKIEDQQQKKEFNKEISNEGTLSLKTSTNYSKDSDSENSIDTRA